MKVLSNWRYCLMVALFFIGLLALARAVSEPTEPMTDIEWFKQYILSLSVSGSSFYALAKLTRRWERKNLIPEYTNDPTE